MKDEDVLIKLRRQYSKDEVVAALTKQIRELKFELGVVTSERYEYKDEFKLRIKKMEAFKKLQKQVKEWEKKCGSLRKEKDKYLNELLVFKTQDKEVRKRESGLITPDWLMELHSELDLGKAHHLMAFCSLHTINYKECYGDGSIMFPMWKKSLQIS